MTNKLVVIINSLKVPKIKEILLYEIKFLVPNYSCLQNPWLGGYRPQIPVLSVLCPQMNLLNPPPRTKFLGTPLLSDKLSHWEKKTSAEFTFLTALVESLRESGSNMQRRLSYDWGKSRRAWIMVLFDVNCYLIYLLERCSFNGRDLGSRQLQTAWKAQMSDCKDQPVFLGCLTISFGTDRSPRHVGDNSRPALCRVLEQERSNLEIIDNPHGQVEKLFRHFTIQLMHNI